MLKIKYPLLIILILSVFPSILSAQSNLGLRLIAPQFSNFTKKVALFKSEANNQYKKASYMGCLAGLTYRTNITKRHYILVECLYSMRGEKYKYTAYKLNGADIITVGNNENSIEYYLNYSTHYIELPVMYSIDLAHNVEKSVPFSFYFSIGFSAGANVVSKQGQNSFESDGGFGFSSIEEIRTENHVSEINPLLLNFVTDVEAEFLTKKRIQLFGFVRYNQSLTNVFSDDLEDSNTKVGSFSFGFGMRCRIKS